MVDKRQPQRHLPVSPKKDPRDKPQYPLNDVVVLIEQDKVEIWDSAMRTAKKDFGWDSEDILKAFKMLKEKDFYKRVPSDYNSWLELDVYKAHIRGELIYTHF